MVIGDKIKQLRIRNGLTQEELADRCELTKGFISQLERDLTSPSINTLMDILETLGTNLRDFFGDRIEEKLVFGSEDVSIKENKELGSTIEWLVPNSQKNRMEPILVQLAPMGETAIDDPHEGEEFGYILQGTIQLVIGDEQYRVRKGESFYFTSGLPHYIKNEGKKPASLLWIATPPSF